MATPDAVSLDDLLDFDHEDEDMANLFSFGSGEVSEGANDLDDLLTTGITPTNANSTSGAADAATTPSRATDSPDSFLELLSAETAHLDLDGGLGLGVGINGSSTATSTMTTAATSTTTATTTANGTPHDTATLELLHWLDEADPGDAEEEIVFDLSASLVPPPEKETVVVPPPSATVVALPPTFDTLTEALESSESTVSQLRRLAHRNFEQWQPPSRSSDNTNSNNHSPTPTIPSYKLDITPSQRAELYCRLVCNNKSLDQVLHSSLADSFDVWNCGRTVSNDAQVQSTEADLKVWMAALAGAVSEATGRPRSVCETELVDVVLYHMMQHNHSSSSSAPSATPVVATDQATDGDTTNKNGTTVDEPQSHRDALVPAVAATILSAGVPVAGATVVLSQLIPTFMPLLALPPSEERWQATHTLHSEFHWLACYHVPLLVFHLDRYVPGWYWPKPMIDSSSATSTSATSTTTTTTRNRNLKQQGQLPPSWLATHLAGECGGTLLPPATVLALWDGILTADRGPAASARFFLTLAVLEGAAERLLLLAKGADMVQALAAVWTLDGLPMEDSDNETSNTDWLSQWWPRALALQDATPTSVLRRLEVAEDTAVQHAFRLKQERTQAALRARLEAEAAAHQAAQERTADEARQRLSRARLVAFYRIHAPGKEDNIDTILETYEGRLDELDFKLKKKYGEGFNPAVKPKPPKGPNKLLASMKNNGFVRKKSGVGDPDDDLALLPEEERLPDRVSVAVTADEVLPVVCWSKEATVARGVQRRKRNVQERTPLKFYLVDSRSDEAAQAQGRFPTAVSLSPEVLLDPERMQQNEEMFESLRGAVHIVIMGEGFNAIPRLYNQKLSPKLTTLMEEDEARTNSCALFFQKRGFCFLSVLDGGYCAAHSWLIRQGPSHHLNASAVLMDYRPDASLFGQLESLHNASATEKAQRKMNNLLESSLVSMTKRAQQLERLTSDMDNDNSKGRPGIRMNFFRRDESTADATNASAKAVAAASPTAASSTDATTTATAKTTATTPTQDDNANPFKGIGAAFSKARAAAAAAQPETAPRTGGGAGGFGGFGRFRMNRMVPARTNSIAKADANATAATTATAATSTATAATTPAATTATTTTGTQALGDESNRSLT